MIKRGRHIAACASLIALPWLVAPGAANTSNAVSATVDRYHDALTRKFGKASRQISVHRVTNPILIRSLRRVAETTRLHLIEFANSIGAEDYEYRMRDEYWRVAYAGQTLSYTVSIEIQQESGRVIDYHCNAVLDELAGTGFTSECTAY